jgi:hypothetical protein
MTAATHLNCAFSGDGRCSRHWQCDGAQLSCAEPRWSSAMQMRAILEEPNLIG